MIGLFVASVTILIRSIYRCVELAGGFNGTLFVSDEALFMVLEGAMIVIATVALTALHPAVCFQGVWHEANFSFRMKKSYRLNKSEDLNSGAQSEMSNVPLNDMA